MRLFMAIAVFVGVCSSSAFAGQEWFPVVLLDDEVMVVSKGLSMEDCVQRRGELLQKTPTAFVRCSHMGKKVRSENKDGRVEWFYKVYWLEDFVHFERFARLEDCEQLRARLTRPGMPDLFVCAQSFQLID